MSTPPQLEALYNAERRLARELHEWRDAGAPLTTLIGAIAGYIDARIAYREARPEPPCRLCGNLFHLTAQHRDGLAPHREQMTDRNTTIEYRCVHATGSIPCDICYPNMLRR